MAARVEVAAATEDSPFLAAEAREYAALLGAVLITCELTGCSPDCPVADPIRRMAQRAMEAALAAVELEAAA